MTIPIATVRSLCSASELAIVRASRKPEIDELSPSELKRFAARARKQFDKWNELSRGQARKGVRQTGTSDTPKNTKRKAQIFREALGRFEAKLAKLGGSGRAKTSQANLKKTKRAAEHRASRAAVRKGMTAAEDLLNSSPRKKHK